ncbi:PAS domain S-box-containing protein [Ruminococcaceae bacterium YRB3002]|nr:PAS domain S-box-containing protein [Ruminococcaceae bacterium YRB3002]
MNELNINIFCNLSNNGIEDVMKSVTFGNNVNVRFCDMFEDAVGYSVLLSESIEEATAFKSAGSSRSKLFSIFIGDSRLAENRCDTLDDIWPPKENANIIKGRFKKLIAYIESLHNSWFYRNLYETAIDSLPDLAWCKDVTGRYFSVNTSFSDTVHKTKAECEGKDHCSIWDADKDANAKEAIACKDSDDIVIKEQRTLKFEESITSSDGMMKLVTYKSPLSDEFGNTVGIVGIARDITNVMNIEREKDLIIDSVPFPVIVVDANWKTTRINATMRRLLGLKGPDESFDYLTWKKYFLTPVSELMVNEERHYTNQIFAANDSVVPFHFQINEQDIIDVFGELQGHIIIPRKLGPNGEMLGVTVNLHDN